MGDRIRFKNASICRGSPPAYKMKGWTSPSLGIRFEMTEESLELYRPDGQRFLTSVELEQRARAAEERARAAEERATVAEERANEAIARIQILEERLRREGINPK